MNEHVTADQLGSIVEGAEKAPTRPDLSFRKFPGAELAGVNLSRVDLIDADFTGADLTGANLDETDCTTTRFVDARLNDAKFLLANCVGADFTGADLRGTNFKLAHLTGAKGVLAVSGFGDCNVVAYPTCHGWMMQAGSSGDPVRPCDVRARLEAGVPDDVLDGLGFGSDYELRAVVDLVEAWAAARPELLAAVQKWGS